MPQAVQTATRVTGNVVPEETREVDLSPFYISEFQSSGYRLRFSQPLTLLPELDDTRELICLEHAGLGIGVFAPTRDLLEQELQDDLDVLWRNYALAEDDQLTQDARQLKKNLLAAVEVLRDAA